MNLIWALAAARAMAGVVARAVAGGPPGFGRFDVWDHLADWCVDGRYSRALAAEAASRTRVAHLEADVKTLRDEKARLHLRAGGRP